MPGVHRLDSGQEIPVREPQEGHVEVWGGAITGAPVPVGEVSPRIPTEKARHIPARQSPCCETLARALLHLGIQALDRNPEADFDSPCADGFPCASVTAKRWPTSRRRLSAGLPVFY